ncbi:MAG: hypothetical protein HY564_01675, partial [Candidatus Jacksonbacteria bacterium]|nr:hypothetical protein [Candidatus Jacksonbacteria bacterium]
ITIRERKNRGLVTDAATGRQKAGTVFLLIGSIIALILFGLYSNRLNSGKTTRPYQMIQEETGALGEAVQE